MKNPNIYRAENGLWATSVELVQFDPELTSPRQTELVDLKAADEDVDFFVAAVSTPDGTFPPYLDTKLVVIVGNNALKPTKPTDPTYVSDHLVILPKPKENNWTIKCESGAVPYTMCATAFHNATASGSSPGAPPPKPRIRCRFCKTTAKALAMAIAGAATASVVPTALVVAVGAFLGFTVVPATSVVIAGGATAFITSCFGDSVDVIMEKLCAHGGLCP